MATYENRMKMQYLMRYIDSKRRARCKDGREGGAMKHYWLTYALGFNSNWARKARRHRQSRKCQKSQKSKLQLWKGRPRT